MTELIHTTEAAERFETWGELNLPLSHTHIFKIPFALFVGTSNLQCLVCPLSNCDNASLGSCSGGPASLCFLGSS